MLRAVWFQKRKPQVICAGPWPPPGAWLTSTHTRRVRGGRIPGGRRHARPHAARRRDRATARADLIRFEGQKNIYILGQHLLLAAGILVALGDLDTAVERLREAFAAGLYFTTELHALPMLRPPTGREDVVELLAPRDV